MCLTQIYPQISDIHEEDRLTPLQVTHLPVLTCIYYEDHRLPPTPLIILVVDEVTLNWDRLLRIDY